VIEMHVQVLDMYDFSQDICLTLRDFSRSYVLFTFLKSIVLFAL